MSLNSVASAERIMQVENLDSENEAISSEELKKCYDDFEYIKKQCNITADYNSYQQKEEHIVAECIYDFFNHLSTTL